MPIELILGGIVLILVFVLYRLAINKGKSDAEKSQLLQSFKAKQYYDNHVDARMERFEEKQNKFEDHVKSLDYSKLSNDQLKQLRQGSALDDIPTNPESITVVEFDPESK